MAVNHPDYESAAALALPPEPDAASAPKPAAVRGVDAVFLDKDGTLLIDVPHNIHPARMQLAPAVATGLRTLAQLDCPLIVVSNQPGVALGLFPERALHAVQERLAEMFLEHGARLAGFHWCLHAPSADGTPACICRKPAPGLITAAARSYGVDPRRSWMIGDILDDVEAGRRAGCRTILIDNGHETVWKRGPMRRPHHVTADFGAAARVIADATRQAGQLP
jgi:histidinol-phosphate phosphatase family protein